MVFTVIETDGMIDNDESVYFKMMDENPSTEIGMYTADFTVNSIAEMDGSDNFSNNISSREFMISEDLYSLDGIDVYTDSDVTRLGTGSFTDGTDGFMMMTYYEIAQETDVAGLQIMLDSYLFGENSLTVSGGEMIISLRDTAAVNAETFSPSETLVESDFYMLTEQDVSNGYVDIPVDSPYTLSAGGYYDV